MADTLHLTYRKGTWYYRRRVPEHLVAAFGRKVIFLSLRTKSKAEAKKFRAVEDTKWDARFEAAEAALEKQDGQDAFPRLSRREAEKQVRDYVERMHRRFEELLQSDPPTDRDELREMREEAETDLTILRNPGDPRQHEHIDLAWNQILGQSGASVDDEPEFADLVWRALLELSHRKVARCANDFERPYFDALFKPAQSPQVTFGELAGQYLAQQHEDAAVNGVAQKGTDKMRANVALIREIIGDATPVASIDYDACRRAVSLLAQTPSNRTKHYPMLPLAKAIERGRADGKPVLSVTSQGQYLGTLKHILELATLKGFIPHNPAQSLRPIKRDRVGDSERRLPFSLDQLKAIFTSDFYRRCAPGAPSPYNKPDREWRFWLPLICLFMGMRPNEVGQLAVRDVRRTQNGTWYVDVTSTGDDDASSGLSGKKTLKTAASRRRVPIHPELISIGFLSFVEQRRKVAGDGASLLPGLKPDQHGNRATYALKRFRDSFLPKVVAVDRRQSFYSLRHSFRDALRRCDAPPSALQALGGWSQGKLTSDSYGDQFDPDYQRQWIERVSFPGLDLTFLHEHQHENA